MAMIDWDCIFNGSDDSTELVKRTNEGAILMTCSPMWQIPGRRLAEHQDCGGHETPAERLLDRH